MERQGQQSKEEEKVMAPRGRNKARKPSPGKLNKNYNPTPKIPAEPKGQIKGPNYNVKKFGFKSVWETGTGSAYGIGTGGFNVDKIVPLNTQKKK